MIFWQNDSVQEKVLAYHFVGAIFLLFALLFVSALHFFFKQGTSDPKRALAAARKVWVFEKNICCTKNMLGNQKLHDPSDYCHALPLPFWHCVRFIQLWLMVMIFFIYSLDPYEDQPCPTSNPLLQPFCHSHNFFFFPSMLRNIQSGDQPVSWPPLAQSDSWLHKRVGLYVE